MKRFLKWLLTGLVLLSSPLNSSHMAATMTTRRWLPNQRGIHRQPENSPVGPVSLATPMRHSGPGTRTSLPSWLIQRDVDEGRDELNWSEWGPDEEGDEGAETGLEGSMPPDAYSILHPEARLSDHEIDALVAGLVATFGSDDDTGSDNGGEDSDDEDDDDDD